MNRAHDDANELKFGPFALDLDKKVLWENSEPVKLPAKTIQLLCLLASNTGEVITKELIWEHVWDGAFVGESNLSHHIYLLRKLFRQIVPDREVIQTVPRCGYRFVGFSDVDVSGTVIERRTLSEITIEEFPEKEFVRTDRWMPRSRATLLAASSAALIFAVLVGVLLLRSDVGADQPGTIAVLPFRVVAGEDQEFVGEGVAEMIASHLTAVEGLRVRSANGGRSGTLDALSEGERLGVECVIEGDIFQGAERSTVSVRLVRVSDGSVLWAKFYERPGISPYELISHVSIDVAGSVAERLGLDRRTATPQSASARPDALRLYLEGRHNWAKRDAKGNAEAQRLFKNAIARDSEFALAYVGLADTMIFDYYNPESTAAISKALELDPNLAEAYASRGFSQMFHGWNWDGAEADLKKAIELKPGYSTARQWYGTLMMIRGRHDDAITALYEALETDPGSYSLLADLAQAHYYRGDYERSKEYCERSLEIKPDFAFAHNVLKDVYLQTEDFDRAFEQIQKTAQLQMQPATPSAEYSAAIERTMAPAREAYREGGMPQFLRSFIDTVQRGRPLNPNEYIFSARADLMLGSPDNAIRNLETAFENRAFIFPFVRSDPAFQPIRDHPRFISLMAKAGL